MKKYVLASCFAAVALLISSISIAQNTTKPAKEKPAAKEKPRKEKMDDGRISKSLLNGFITLADIWLMTHIPKS